jgi:uncharacterized membrane protein
VVPDPADENIPSIGRLLTLTDGVVAIALTLLVLQFRVPVTDALVRNPHSASLLWHALALDGDSLTSYLVAFVVIAQFWLVHHRMLSVMRGHSEGLAWRNFGFLLALTLMPFTSELYGRYGNNPVSITLFGLNLVAIGLTTQWIYHYAARHNLLLEKGRSPHDELVNNLRSFLRLAIVGLAILLAWFDTGFAKYAWLLFIVMPWIAERIVRSVERKRSQPAVETGA